MPADHSTPSRQLAGAAGSALISALFIAIHPGNHYQTTTTTCLIVIAVALLACGGLVALLPNNGPAQAH